MTAKTGAERQQALLERRKAAGLKQVRNLWCDPADEPEIRRYAAALQAKRARRQNKEKAA